MTKDLSEREATTIIRRFADKNGCAVVADGKTLVFKFPENAEFAATLFGPDGERKHITEIRVHNRIMFAQAILKTEAEFAGGGLQG